MEDLRKKRNFVFDQFHSELKVYLWILFFLLIVVFFFLNSCSNLIGNFNMSNLNNSGYKIGDIIISDTGKIVSFDEMIADLVNIPIVYIGEQHSNYCHHDKQLEIISALFERGYEFKIGMEMFDCTYQEVLHLWVKGLLNKIEFLRATHWYTNWRYDFNLYENILDFAKKNELQIIGLSIPFHIPSKISIGGIDSLFGVDKSYLPDKTEFASTEHKEYVAKVYEYHKIPGRENFDLFYEAQCVWEDSMAQNILENLNNGNMVVLVGNGHIINKFGIPERVEAISNLSFKTVYLTASEDELNQSLADYIIFTKKE